MGEALGDVLEQPKEYIRKLRLKHVRYIVVTNGATLFVYAKKGDIWNPTPIAFLDVTCLQREYTSKENKSDRYTCNAPTERAIEAMVSNAGYSTPDSADPNLRSQHPQACPECSRRVQLRSARRRADLLKNCICRGLTRNMP
jgi:magnesium-transporting ATPase (P-type)